MDEGVFVGAVAVAMVLAVATARWLRRRLLGRAGRVDGSDLDLLAYVSGGPDGRSRALARRVSKPSWTGSWPGAIGRASSATTHRCWSPWAD